ncbi:MAG: hypothetical protein E6J90_07130 [Deltaproteobacteria bacterium]|nr:MAG: hypothetical protein E6J90_07130 [Deltaproteobacteria bacterium]
MSDDDDDPDEDDESEGSFAGPAVGRPRYEDVICQLLAQNARMVETTLGQMGTVIAGVAELLHAAHQTGITSRVLPPAPLPPPVPPPLQMDYDEDEDQSMDATPGSMLPDALRLIIEKAVDKLVPLIFEKVTSGGGLGGLPLGALLDWRKAVPTPATTPSAPAAPAAPSAPVASSMPAAPSSSRPPASAYAAHAVTAPPPPAPAPAGAVPSPASPLGAAPAEMAPTTPTTSSPVTQEDAAAMLNAHILQIWQGLSPPERTRASQLIAGLSDEQRTAWLAELARLTVPEAIARARAVLRAQSAPTPPTHPLLTATPKGDPS